jgi:hypothetical protein
MPQIKSGRKVGVKSLTNSLSQLTIGIKIKDRLVVIFPNGSKNHVKYDLQTASPKPFLSLYLAPP